MASAFVLLCPCAMAQGDPDRVVIEGHYDNAVGSTDAASQGVIRAELLKSRPALRPGELLEFVPGVIVTQHSGDGKANQYFLRGFNLDHGTDFATSIDGMPVNMPTHGHGQGYTDLNFLIPELVDRIEYRKGPYLSRSGDFAAAGSADIRYRRSLAQPLAQLTLGERGYQRLVGAGSTPVAGDTQLLGALELMHNDGPWTLPEHLKKASGALILSQGDRERGWSASLMGHGARWDATDQVPQRAIDAGTLGRFDAIDTSDGGSTSRASLAGEWHRRQGDDGLRISAYAMRYRLDLFSNFTYALERAGGDQFEQRDSRSVFGLNAARDWGQELLGRPSRSELGVQLRHDRIRVGLFDTVARQRVGTTRDDAVRETSLALYAENSLAWTPWLRTVAGVRADTFRFAVDSSLPANSGRSADTQVSPKLSVVLGPWQHTEFFINAGRGFHSNDARGTTSTVDPKTQAPVTPVPGLVASTGWELGARTEALRGLQSSLALWELRSRSELVYVGDAGTTEANRPSRRRGIEWNNRYVPVPWLLVDADLAWTRARFSDSSPDGDRIPGAVERVASAAITLRDMGAWSASLQWRYLGPRPLVEDDSQRAAASLLTNLRVSRKLTRDAELSVDVFNLLDRQVNDIEYLYESRLPTEAAAVLDRHVHPAEPRTLRVTLQLRF
ncbi:TonB-dependent receptor [Ideonella sp. BN130291]|uniref:TonB-dependent receptor n=1 Tax=Ideonella sp. BN130291 TaxID=3112940 RepID=UPI002E266507|nr:TonB-dependent receptor [Ideonella sp. BN130291]